MPIIKSAIKRAKQSLVRRSRNLQTKRAIKADVTALHQAIAAGDASDVQAKLSAAYSELDRAVKKNTLHKNTAARRKGQLANAAKAVAETKEAPAAKEAKATMEANAAPAAKATTAKKPAAKKPAATKKPAAKKAE